MKEQFTKAVGAVKEFWQKLTPHIRKLILFGGGALLAVAIILTVLLNTAGSQYEVLFPQLSSAETTEVYAVLQEMEASPQVNSKGEIMVPKENWGQLKVELAAKGYPKSAPSYGIYFDNAGLTTTDANEKAARLFQLQNRIQDTLTQIKGIELATVTISVPEESNYVWEQTQKEGSATVMITMASGSQLSSEMVSGIKALVGKSVTPQIKTENVTVVDASTGVEMRTDDSQGATGGVDFRRLEFERQMQKDIEDNVKKLLSTLYGPEGVTVTAKVHLDYDKMMTESKEFVPQETGDGLKTHQEESSTTSGTGAAGGVVGEDQNTDTPTYNNQTGDGDGTASDYYRSTDWENSYILKQIEKGAAILKDASVAVIVNDTQFDQERKDTLLDLVSKGTGIDKGSIMVTNRYNMEGQDQATLNPEGEINIQRVLILAGAVLLLLAVIILIVVLLLRRRAKKMKAVVEEESENKIRDLQVEIEQHKRELLETAQANNTKENAITNEVRQFAKENPEITATLIRSMLKEDE